MGRGIVLRLADDGYDVAVNDLPGAPELDEVVEPSVNKGSASHLHTRRRFG
jgi:NAD(P)-dependent dehydrogenase (short-subunit alcohol dehydrogenase family)